ncbi:MAG: biopolymer transporter ExbD [Planctomycetaceae bacterium]
MRMDLTPMIDMVFNLVVFFLVASHFSNEAETPVELPRAETSKADEDDPHRLVITITESEQVFIKEHAIELPELIDLVRKELDRNGPDFIVQIRSDRRVPYRAVEPLLLTCSQIGVKKFGFKTAGE